MIIPGGNGFHIHCYIPGAGGDGLYLHSYVPGGSGLHLHCYVTLGGGLHLHGYIAGGGGLHHGRGPDGGHAAGQPVQGGAEGARQQRRVHTGRRCVPTQHGPSEGAGHPGSGSPGHGVHLHHQVGWALAWITTEALHCLVG